MKTQQKCSDDPTTSSSSNLDDNVFDFEVLQCPLCSRQLVPMELDIINIEGEKYQRIWWTCSGLKTQSCEFPTFLPENVFWTQRSMKQMRNGFFPLPNLHLLPPEYWHLYPKLFDSQNGFIDKPLIGRKKQKLVYSLSLDQKLARKSFQNTVVDGKEQIILDSDLRSVAPETSSGMSFQSTSEAGNTGLALNAEQNVIVEGTLSDKDDGNVCGSKELTNVLDHPSTSQAAGSVPSNTSTEKTGTDTNPELNAFADKEKDSSNNKDAESSAACLNRGCFVENTHRSTGDARLPDVSNSGSRRKASLSKKVRKSTVDKAAEIRDCLLSPESSIETGNETDKEDESDKLSDLGTVSGVMNRITLKHQNLLSRRKALLEEKKSILEKRIKKRGYTIDASVVPYENLRKCRAEPVNRFITQGIPAEDILEEKESFTRCRDCFNFLRDFKEEPLDEGVSRRGLTLEGTPTSFRSEHFPSSIIDPLNWYRQVHLSGRTALDGFMAWYNLRYNRKQYLEVMAAELCKRGVMKYVPSIPIKQQRMVKQLREEVYGKKCVDIEALKKSFDSSALRLQMAHRLGVPNVEPLIEKRKVVGGIDQANTEDKFGEMRPLSSVPIITTPFYRAGDGSGFLRQDECPFEKGLPAVEEVNHRSALSRRSVSAPGFTNLNLPKGSVSMMSDYLTTGDREVDEFLQKKVVKQMQQAFDETKFLKQDSSGKKRSQPEVQTTMEPTIAKQRRISEASQGKEEEFRTNFEGLLEDYYDEDEEFCAQIYGT